MPSTTRTRTKPNVTRETDETTTKAKARTKRTKAGASHERTRDGVARLLAGPSNPAIMTPEMQARFDALAQPTVTELECTICGEGRGLPKVENNDVRCCVVCYAVLADFEVTDRLKVLTLVAKGTLNRQKWAEYRLPHFRTWLASENRIVAHTNVVENIA